MYTPEKEKLTFFIFNNLRFQQDGVEAEIKRFDRLQDAIEEYNLLPKNYTSALGGYLNDNTCIDFIHRCNGESVLVNDFKKIEKWANNSFVKQAINDLIIQLNVKFESDINILGYQCPILIPLSNQDKINSYYKDKFLQPHYSNTKNLLSSINEVFIEGEGWIPAKEFFKNFNNISPSKETYRPKLLKYNVNYIDQKGRCGQADVSPFDFALLKKQTEENQKPLPLDKQINNAKNNTTEKQFNSKNKFSERENR